MLKILIKVQSSAHELTFIKRLIQDVYERKKY